MTLRKILFEPESFDQFEQWSKEDKKVFQKILSLIRDIQRNPFSGLGKPEPLKYQLRCCWQVLFLLEKICSINLKSIHLTD